MSSFKSHQQYVRRPKLGAGNIPITGVDGKPVLETVEVPRWSKEAGINFLKAKGRELTRAACRDGWHVMLLDFVQYRHRLPNDAECEELVMDHQKVEAATPHSIKRPEILKKRADLAEQLLEPLQLKATG